MVRVNIEPGAIPRAIKLSKYVGVSVREALGTVVLLWAESQDQLKIDGDPAELIDWAGLDELNELEQTRWLEALIKARFISENDSGKFEIRGNEIQIEARVSRIRAAQKGGEATKRRWAEVKAKGKAKRGPQAMPEARQEARQYKTRQDNTRQDKTTPPEGVGVFTPAAGREEDLEFDLPVEPCNPDLGSSGEFDGFWDWANEEAADTLAELEPVIEQLPFDELEPEISHETAPPLRPAGEERTLTAPSLSPERLAEIWERYRGLKTSGCRDLTDARRRKANVQLKKYPDPAHWILAAKALAVVGFDWRPGFDDFLDSEKRARALEGKYAGTGYGGGKSKPQAVVDSLGDQARRVAEGSL